jgi:hypothetical protein
VNVKVNVKVDIKLDYKRKIKWRSMNTPVAELDWVPIKDLSQQYGVSKTAFYNRLTALGVEPMKRGTKSYISSQQLELLNELHQYMHSGGTMADFMELHGFSNAQTNGHQHQSKYPSQAQPNETQTSLPPHSVLQPNLFSFIGWGMLHRRPLLF